MNYSKWSEFRDLIAACIAKGAPSESWVAYPYPLKNARSAQSTAGIMRKRFPDLEIKTRQGVVYARVRPGAPQEARTA